MFTENNEQHSMHLAGTDPSGVEEWYCPECGRRILMQWPPHYKKVVLEQGNDNVIHSASSGGVKMTNLEAGALNSMDDPSNHATGETGDDPTSELLLTPQDEIRLARWDEMLTSVGFEAWWG